MRTQRFEKNPISENLCRKCALLQVDELFAMLRESESLDEQGDILQFLVASKGLDYNTDMLENGRVVTVRDLLKGELSLFVDLYFRLFCFLYCLLHYLYSSDILISRSIINIF